MNTNTNNIRVSICGRIRIRIFVIRIIFEYRIIRSPLSIPRCFWVCFYMQVLLSLVSICLSAPFSTMDSDAEHIHAYNGFYGNPIYRWRIINNVCKKEVLNYCEIPVEIFSKWYLNYFRPYGFGSWGFGSSGFGKKMLAASRPNSFYGGYSSY